MKNGENLARIWLEFQCAFKCVLDLILNLELTDVDPTR